MGNRGTLTKIFAAAGTVLVWIPILFAVVTGAVGTIMSGTLRFDYLIPAELFPIVLVGAGLVLIAAFRARIQQKLFFWSLAAMIVFLAGGQLFAAQSGLASGVVEAAGMIWALVVGMIILYSLTVLEFCIAGLMLLRILFAKP